MQAESGNEYELETCFKVNQEKHIYRRFFAVCFKLYLYTESPTLVAVLVDNCRAAVSKSKPLLQEGERQEVNKLPSLGKQKLARLIVIPQGHGRGKPLKRRF